MKTNKLVIHLVGEQIRNQVLIIAMENLGFDCSMYALNISEVVLTLAGFESKPEVLYQRYFELIENAVEETTYKNMDEMIGKWSKQIFSELQDIKRNGLPP